MTMNIRLWSTRLTLIPATTIGTILVVLGALLGLWWMVVPVGVLAGLLVAGARNAMAAGGIAALLGWGLPLAWQSVALGQPVSDQASVVGAILGFGANQGVLVIALTLLIAVVLGVAGVWVGAALRPFVPRQRTIPPTIPPQRVVAPTVSPQRAVLPPQRAVPPTRRRGRRERRHGA